MPLGGDKLGMGVGVKTAQQTEEKRDIGDAREAQEGTEGHVQKEVMKREEEEKRRPGGRAEELQTG